MKNIVSYKCNQNYNNLQILVNYILKNRNSSTIDPSRNPSELYYNKRRRKLSKRNNMLNNSSSKKSENESFYEYKARLNDQIGNICNKAYNFQENKFSTIENNENDKQIFNLENKQRSYDSLINSVLPNKPKINFNEICPNSHREKKLKPITSSLKIINDKVNDSYEKKLKKLNREKIKTDNIVTNENKPLVNYDIYFEDKSYKVELPPIKLNRFLEKQIPDIRVEKMEENQKRFDYYKLFKIREKLYKFKY